jgi:protein AIR1/2
VTLVCYGCGQRGHRFDVSVARSVSVKDLTSVVQTCPKPLPSAERRRGCDRCGQHDHLSTACPSLWRIYAYRSAKSREEETTKRDKLQGWAKEAAGGDPYSESCYNCSKVPYFLFPFHIHFSLISMLWYSGRTPWG